jgi:hypothetical protein
LLGVLALALVAYIVVDMMSPSSVNVTDQKDVNMFDIANSISRIHSGSKDGDRKGVTGGLTSSDDGVTPHLHKDSGSGSAPGKKVSGHSASLTSPLMNGSGTVAAAEGESPEVAVAGTVQDCTTQEARDATNQCKIGINC